MSEARPRKVVFTPGFDRALKRYAGRDAKRRKCVNDTIHRLMTNLTDPRLRTHALTGSLAGSFACFCGYDCRIVFELDRLKGEDCIVLVAVGTHDEVY